MKTNYLTFAKGLCALLMMLTYFQNASASVREEIVIVEGFEYMLTYDDETWSGSAAMITRSWDMENNEWCSIQYDGWNTDSVYVVPSSIGDFPVTSIYGGFGGFSDLKNVIIPYTVTTIGRGAFANSSIETIFFDNSNPYGYDTEPITFGQGSQWYGSEPKLGEFKGCERLTTVEFRRPINQFSSCMFMNCPKLENVYFNFSSDHDENNFSIDTIGNFAFFNCSGLTHFQIPNTVKVIGNGAFAYCTNLKNINIPSGVTHIGNYAFAECHQLQGMTLNPALQFIGEAAFLNCKSLSSISIPDAITTIRSNTFYNCSNLTSLNLNNVTTFGERSFAGCHKLTELDLTKADSIGEAAFFGGSVYCVASSNIYGYDSLYLSISYREEGWATAETTLGSLKKITLGENVTLLNERTFVGHVLDTITCWAPAPPIFSRTDNRDWVFSTQVYDSTVLRVPQVLINDYREAYNWSRFANIEGMNIMGNGDVNGDGQLTIGDITALIDMLLNTQAGNGNPINSDVNGDGNITIGDITVLIDKLLAGN